MLFTNGCSFVWGDELPGFNTNPPTHQHHRFSDKLAKSLDIDLMNHASCGGSNHKIFRDTLNFLSSEHADDCTHMVIVWSAWEREEIVNDVSPEDEDLYHVPRYNSITQVSPSRINSIGFANKLTKDVLRLYYDEMNLKFRTAITHQMSYMIAIHQICEARGIKLVMTQFHRNQWRQLLNAIIDCDRPEVQSLKDWQHMIKKMMYSLPKKSRLGFTSGKSFSQVCTEVVDKYNKCVGFMPGHHPSAEAHTAFAKYIEQKFQEE
jgi:hypothetical protein